jgi:Protein of unknown function (DUF2892)
VGAGETWPIQFDFEYQNLNAMKKNMGTIDRGIRVGLAIAFVVLFFTNVATGVLGYALLAFAAIFVGTSAMGFCPLYTLFGIRTCPADKA